MTPYLFVYGTLKRSHSNPVANYLHQRVEWMGDAKMPGLIYELGAYTGAVYLKDAGEWVDGEVFKMNDPEGLLKVLDEYEGVGSTFSQPTEYIRRLCPVTMEGQTYTCWVYLYNWPFPA